MSGIYDITTALNVAQSLLRGVDLEADKAEEQFSRAFGVFFELYQLAAPRFTSSELAHSGAAIIADYARSVLRQELTFDVAVRIVKESLASADEADYAASPARVTEGLSALVLQAEAEILKSALRVRRCIEQLPLGQDTEIAAEYVLTLIVDKAHDYAKARSEGLTELDGYRIFIATCPILTDITVDGWGRLGTTYYNPLAATFSRASVDEQVQSLRPYLEAYDMGMSDHIDDILKRTGAFIFEFAEQECARYDYLSNRDRQGICHGIANHLIATSQRAWRLCINNVISEVDDLLTDESKALAWLDSDAPPIDTAKLFAAIRRLYSESPGFSVDADIDLETLDVITNQEFAITVQAADAMIEEVRPWSMTH